MENIKFIIEKSARIDKLVNHLYEKMPEIESARGILVTESYKQTENLPIILRRAKAFAHILENLPITIRPLELPRSRIGRSARNLHAPYPNSRGNWDGLHTV